MTSHVRKWFKWQRAGIGTVLRNRVSRANNGKYDGEIFAPCAMSYVAIDTHLSASLTAGPLAKLGDLADAYLARTLCYVARTSALKGEIHVTRSLFGPKVLSTDTRLVSTRKGGQVWDAFHESAFLVEGEAELPEWVFKITDSLENKAQLGTYQDTHQDTLTDVGHDVDQDTLSRARSGSGSGSGSGVPTPLPPLTRGDGSPSASPPDPDDVHRLVLQWAGDNLKSKSELLAKRAKDIIRENAELRGASPGRMVAREFAWIGKNDPAGWARARRNTKRAAKRAARRSTA